MCKYLPKNWQNSILIWKIFQMSLYGYLNTKQHTYTVWKRLMHYKKSQKKEKKEDVRNGDEDHS